LDIREEILNSFQDALVMRHSVKKETITDDTVLLESGLDSLGFATLVALLEEKLDYDPFTLMEDPIYPVTFGEFVAVYERCKDSATQSA
jgi:acyl carrier protein